jgi:predicted transcriptional regulator
MGISRDRRMIKYLILTAFFVFPFVFSLPIPAEGASITTVSILIDEKTKVMDLQSDNKTLFSGNISVFTTSTNVIIVKLRAYFSTDQYDWSSELEPEIMYFDQTAKKGFKVRISVPPFTSGGHHPVTIAGEWKFEDEDAWDSVSDEVFVTIPQFNSISIEPTDSMLPYLELDKSSELYYNFYIRNDGNVKDSLTIDLINEPELLAIDWNVRFNPFKFPFQQDINEFAAYEINLSISPPSLNIPFETSVNFQLSSEDVPELQETFQFYIYSEQDRFLIVPGGRSLVILTPLDSPVKTITNDEVVEFKVEARCYVRDAAVSLKPLVYSQYASSERTGFDFISKEYWEDPGIEVEVQPQNELLRAGTREEFSIKLKGNNETSESKKFFTVLFIDTEGSTIVGNRLAYEFIYVSDGEKDAFRIMGFSSMQIIAISSVSIMALIAGLVGSTEFGRYGFLALFIPLFTKLHKDKILDHFTRGRIYEYIRSHPGAHFSELKRELKLTNGGLAYHLYTLEREELIRAIRAGKLKLFYTRDFGIPKEPGRQFTELESLILDIIDSNPGITQREVGELILNRNHRTVSHNIKQLSREGYVRLEKEGRSNNCFLDFSQLQRGEGDDKKDSDGKKSSVSYRMEY